MVKWNERGANEWSWVKDTGAARTKGWWTARSMTACVAPEGHPAFTIVFNHFRKIVIAGWAGGLLAEPTLRETALPARQVFYWIFLLDGKCIREVRNQASGIAAGDNTTQRHIVFYEHTQRRKSNFISWQNQLKRSQLKKRQASFIIS